MAEHRPDVRAAVSARRGIDRERKVRDLLANDDWLAFRAPASLGCADVIALRAGSRPRLIEVKSTHRGPYHSFGPEDRRKLKLAAELAGATAELCWWPPRAKPRFIDSSEWPEAA